MSIEQDIAQVCENGHVVNSFSVWASSRNHDFCPNCGAKTHTKCTQCSTPIKGGLRHLGLTDPDTGKPQTLFREDVTSVPSFCPKCGQKFSWAGKQLDNTSKRPSSNPPIFVTNSPGANLHFGSGNIHQQASWVELTNQRIDDTTASPEEKHKAKSLLTKISENKLLSTIIGSAVGELTKAILPK